MIEKTWLLARRYNYLSYYTNTLMKSYDKLVRDKIPEIIINNNESPNTYIASDKEYLIKLKDKLIEESMEFVKDETQEEIADILEVIKAICKVKWFDENDIEKIRLEKKKNRWWFDDKIILKSVD